MKNSVGIYWTDIRFYYDSKIHGTSKAYTEGILLEKNDDYILVQDPETVITSSEGKAENHPHTKPQFYYIPTCLITSMETYGEK